MEVKEAIKFLEYEVIYRHFNRPDITQKNFDKFNKDKQNIIDLLKRGEKFEKREILSELLVDEKVIRGEEYRKMWEELYTEYGMCPIRKNDEEGYMSNILYKILEEIQQKYFPKEIIKEVVKGVTEQIEEGAEIAKNNKGGK